MEWAAIFAVLLTIAMIVVIAVDAHSYIIPNSISIFLLGLYPFAAFLLGLDWPMALLAAGIALLLGMAIFAVGFMGGGDIKLLVVLVLWIGWNIAAAQFLFLTALCGGALVLIVFLARFLLPGIWHGRKVPRLLTRGEPVPYGIAIAAGFLMVLWSGQIPNLSTFF